MNSKERCLAALAGRPVDRVPVFPLLMFFAVDRAGLSYRQFATDGTALAEAQLAVRSRFGIDAITACSDAFRLVADLGAEMVFPESKPPFAQRPLVRTAADLARLGRPDPNDSRTRMADRVRAVESMARAAGDDCLVLGWVDMPFAEACSLCGVSEFMLMLVDEPALAHRILDFLTGLVIAFGVAQTAAGAAMVGAGDAAASLVSPAMYREFALPYEQRVCAGIRAAGGRVKLHICGNTTALLPDMARCGAELFNVDHLVPFERACAVYGGAAKCFKGNLDPVSEIMQATPEQCQARALACLRRARGLPYMLSAGCEIPAETPDEVFTAFCQAPG
ncbi:MAG: Uroporphyrinogen decarboxylase [Lentisphaerae bacterium ADurb.BinA184]|nr:MAG: Uroporphyrinogen decarboxylase [Lentisphaerae bacterium ADurb.BinA184]